MSEQSSCLQVGGFVRSSCGKACEGKSVWAPCKWWRQEPRPQPAGSAIACSAPIASNAASSIYPLGQPSVCTHLQSPQAAAWRRHRPRLSLTRCQRCRRWQVLATHRWMQQMAALGRSPAVWQRRRRPPQTATAQSAPGLQWGRGGAIGAGEAAGGQEGQVWHHRRCGTTHPSTESSPAVTVPSHECAGRRRARCSILPAMVQQPHLQSTAWLPAAAGPSGGGSARAAARPARGEAQQRVRSCPHVLPGRHGRCRHFRSSPDLLDSLAPIHLHEAEHALK